MTKGKVIQIGLFISLIGLISYKFAPQIGIDNFTATTLSSCILISIVITWVTSYVYRVVNGKMTFMEQRKRYSCLLYTSPSPRDKRQSRMPSSA